MKPPRLSFFLRGLGILLLSFFPHPARAQAAFWSKVSWTTADGIRMEGLLHRPSRPSHYTWVLLHGLGSTKEEWDNFSKQLGMSGRGVFIFDARGHGASTQTLGGETISYSAWQSAGPGSPWDAMPGDLGSAVDVLKSRFQIPSSRIAVGGASLGANVALSYAAQHPSVPALALLSPGLEYAGIQSMSPLRAYRLRPLFMAASPGDLYAYSSVRQLQEYRKDPACLVLEGPGSAHGVNMFQGSFTEQLLDWMKKVEKR